MKAKMALRPKKGEAGYSEFDYEGAIVKGFLSILIETAGVMAAFLLCWVIGRLSGSERLLAAKEMLEFFVSCQYFWIAMLVYAWTLFLIYILFRHLEDKEDENGIVHLVDAYQDGQPVRYFIADFPDGIDGFGKKMFILLTIPFWPVYLISWVRMQVFKKQIKTES
ncbi:MAG: hypothetical protein Q4B29_00160 [Candidatus Saccharibacteria bacterium]|nr:hypothetical protein [Candidatus Saccharibacteria bacterium]